MIDTDSIKRQISATQKDQKRVEELYDLFTESTQQVRYILKEFAFDGMAQCVPNELWSMEDDLAECSALTQNHLVNQSEELKIELRHLYAQEEELYARKRLDDKTGKGGNNGTDD